MNLTEAVAFLLEKIPSASVECVEGSLVEISCPQGWMDALLARAKARGWRCKEANQNWASLLAPASVAAATLAEQGIDPRDMTLAEILDEVMGPMWETDEDHPYANAVLAAYERL